MQSLCEAGVPICYFSMGGWFYGITTGLNQKNVFLRRSQFRFAGQDYFARALARHSKRRGLLLETADPGGYQRSTPPAWLPA